jgi:hypothetical protein
MGKKLARPHFNKKAECDAGHQRFMTVILATQEAEIRRIVVQSQAGQTVRETLKKPTTRKRAGGVAQGVGPEFKPQY